MGCRKKPNLGSYNVQELEKQRAEDFKLIEEYKDYYLMGKYTPSGELLYLECFSKFDIDGVTPTIIPKERKMRKKANGKNNN